MKSPVQSLPARIVFFVFAATLLTSLTVTAVSVSSIDSFLRDKINRKFPEILQATHATIESWYDQRLRELAVFAQSRVLQKNIERLGASTPAHRRERAREEIAKYIAYVLGRFPQYSGLFLLDREGEPLLSVGEARPLSKRLRVRMARIETEAVGDALLASGMPLQILSSPLRDADGQTIASLHAVLPLSSLRDILPGEGIGTSGRIYLLDSKGRFLAGTGAAAKSRHPNGEEPAAPGESELESYSNANGERVVARSLDFERFGWSIVIEQPYREAFRPVISTITRILVINLAIVVLVGLAALRVATSIARPIEALSNAARRISEGEQGVITPETAASDEVGVLTRAFNDMTMRLTNNARELTASHDALATANRQLQLRYEELQQANEVLEQLSITDGLTKLHNHRYFQEALQRESKRADRTGKPLSLILVDIDHFKNWNDRLGHAAGDDVLRELAETMAGLVRETDTLSRYGGEEFALIAPDTTIEGATLLAEKIRAAVSEIHPDPDSAAESVTVSVGIAAYAGDRRGLFNRADRALYRAKSFGRDCVILSDEEDG